MSHPSSLFPHGHFETTPDYDFTDDPVHTFLPHIPVLKAQDTRNSARAPRSLATWPNPVSTHVQQRIDKQPVEESVPQGLEEIAEVVRFVPHRVRRIVKQIFEVPVPHFMEEVFEVSKHVSEAHFLEVVWADRGSLLSTTR